MKQSYLNTGLVIFGIIMLVLAASAILGMSPGVILALGGNLFVYLFFMLGFQIALPPFVGYLTRKYAISWLDNKFGPNYREEIPGWIQWIVAIALGLLVGYVWMRLTPLIAFLPALSVWPIDFLRWVANAERVNLWVAVWPAISFVFSYLVTNMNLSE
jgi:hypothetical protein